MKFAVSADIYPASWSSKQRAMRIWKTWKNQGIRMNVKVSRKTPKIWVEIRESSGGIGRQLLESIYLQ